MDLRDRAEGVARFLGGALEEINEKAQKGVEDAGELIQQELGRAGNTKKKIEAKIGLLSVIEKGIKDLSNITKRNTTELVKEISAFYITDLKQKRKVAQKYKTREIIEECSDCLELVSKDKWVKSEADNTALRNMENSELKKVYRIAINVYSSIDKNVQILKETETNNEKADETEDPSARQIK